MRDFAIRLSHQPGELARVARVLAHAGVNMKSVAAMVIGREGMVRFIADNPPAARAALQQAHIEFEEHELVTVTVENRPGELGDIADDLAREGVNLLALYVTGVNGDLVELAIASDDFPKATVALD